MVDNTFSFNNDVTIKVYTHDNVPTTRYAITSTITPAY